MKNQVIVCVALSALALSFTHCATIIRGSKQKVVILSEPKKANVEIDGINVGKTPFEASLERRKKHVVMLSLDGYAPYEITLNRKMNGWIFGNVVFGGLVGIAVDIATGSMYSLTPKDVSAEFNAPLNTFKKQDRIRLTLVMKPDPSWKKIGQLEPASTVAE